jgi:hypothetical protein
MPELLNTETENLSPHSAYSLGGLNLDRNKYNKIIVFSTLGIRCAIQAAAAAT